MPNTLSAGLRARVSLEKHGFGFTHALGQNFILDEAFLDEIVDAAGVGKDDCVLEIGPGPGVLTSRLALRCKRVLSIEIDRKLVPVLQDVLEGIDNAEVLYEDALACDLRALISERFALERVHVVANLPYYITADMLECLLTCGASFESITVMVQKEAAEHICASIGSKSYGTLAMLIQYYCDVEKLMDVPPERFTPPPHIMSSLIRLTRRADGSWAHDERLLLRLIRCAFHMRRKTLVNNLIGSFCITRAQAEALLTQLHLDPRIRGEALSIGDIASLSDALEETIHTQKA